MFNHYPFYATELISETADDGFRYYVTPEGNRYESVTTFINRHWDNSFLEKWRKRVGEAKATSISNGATRRGSSLHKCIEQYLKNDEAFRAAFSHIPTKALFMKLKPLLNRIDNIRMLERSIYSDELKLAGTPDCMADFDGKPSTIDFKTSTRDKEESYITTYWLQCAIYTQMFYERSGIMNEQSVIIMAVENSPQPLIFIEPTYKGMARLQEFLDDPVKFQELL